MQLNESETAIVLVEFQKQWTEKGLFNWLIRHQLESRDVVKNTQRLVTRARENGVTVVHAPLVVDSQSRKGWLAHLTFGRVFTRDTWRTEPVPGLFEEGDLIAYRRYYNFSAFDAFFNSGLEQILNEQGIKKIFICGFATNQCPAKTLRTALRRGFDPYMVSDCTATFNGFFQGNTERKFRERTVTSRELLAGLS